jgi:isocitrate/isopropylmalate dehydrogenase
LAALIKSATFPHLFLKAVPLKSANQLKIAVIGGDGTGPEVTAEALKVLAAVAKLENIKYELKDFDFGGARYLRTGETLPAGAVDELRRGPREHRGPLLRRRRIPQEEHAG